MRTNNTIRKPLAALLLLIFMLSMAPKTYFHTLIANHKDLPGCDQIHTSAVLHKQQINCHCDDLVVTAPFELSEALPEFRRPESRKTFIAGYTPHSLRFFHVHTDSRGPPAV